MNLNDIARIRLIQQQISGSKFKTVANLVDWMCAMQAQDFNMAKWAIGLRLSDATENSVEAAVDAGEIIRTHVLRPTWHLVAASDIYWMLQLTAPRIKAMQKAREKQLELTDTILKKSKRIIEKALRDGKSLKRTELVTHLSKALIVTDNNRLSHILFHAETDALICSGITINKQHTYALLSERVPEKKLLNKEEALFTLAQKYFESHCPATLQDFTWWSGLSVTEAKKAIEMIKPGFISQEVNSQAYWFPKSLSISQKYKDSACLLPAFDEFIISYKDRTAALVVENHAKVVSNNGIFWPTILINGQVRGTWKRKIKKERIIIETNFFEPPGNNTKMTVEKAAEKLAYFLKEKVEIIFSDE